MKELIKEADYLKELLNLKMINNQKTITCIKTTFKNLEEDMKNWLEKIRYAVLTVYENELRNHNFTLWS